MKKQILIATAAYTLLSFLQPLSNFILLPVYTNYFTEADYGTFSILNNIYVLFNIIGGLGIVHAIMAFYSSYNDDKLMLNRYVGNVLAFNTYFNIILLALVSLFGNFIFGVIFKENIDFFPNGFLTISYGLITNVVLGYLFFTKFEKNVKRFAFFSVIQFVLSTVLQYVFIVYLKRGVTGAFESRVLVSLLSLVLVLIYHSRFFFIKIDYAKFIKPSLKYSLKIIPSSTITWLTTFGDRFLIEHFMNLKSLGIYSFLSTISGLTESGFLAVGAALQPFIYDLFKIEDRAKANNLYKVFILLTACVVSFIILLGSNLDWLIHNKGYLEIVPYLTFMTIGYMFSGLTYLFSLQIIYARKSGYFVYIGIIVLTSNILMNYFLTPAFGIWGAVVSSVLTKVLSASLGYYFANRSYSVQFKRNNYTLLLLLLIIIIGCWLVAKFGYLSYSITAVLQFIIIASLVAVEYRQLIRQSYVSLKKMLKKD